MPKVKIVDQSQSEIGDVVSLATLTPTVNMLLCDGSPVSRIVYSKLFEKIGVTFGSGDGVSTFNLPDLRSRSPVGSGQGVGLTNRTRGSTGGLEASSLPNIPSHTHAATSQNAGSHTHTYSRAAATSRYAFSIDAGVVPNSSLTVSEPAHTHAFTTTSRGSGQAHNNLHPVLAVGYAIIFK